MTKGLVFTPDSLAFLSGLAANNSRDWFTANRTTYDENVKAPAEQLKTGLYTALAGLTGQDMTGKIFRLNRDLRFSRDKTPYNAHVRMAFWPAGTAFQGKAAQPPSFFLSIEPDQLIFGAGVMGFSKAMLNAYRQALASGWGAGLEKLLADLGSAEFELSEPDLKKPPPGFAIDAPHAALARHKGLTVWHRTSEPDLIFGPAAAERLKPLWQPALPLWHWLMDLPP